jgi:hypothetical protein
MVVASVVAVARKMIRRFGAPGALSLAVLAGGAAIVGASIVGVRRTGPETAYPIDEAQQILAGVAGVIALLLRARASPADRRFVCHGIAVAIACATLGMAVWDLQPDGWVGGAGPGELLFAAAVVAVMATLARSVFAGMDRTRLAEVGLDAVILLVASVTVVAVLWQRVLDPTGQNQSGEISLGCSLAMISGGTAVYLALLHRGLQPRFGGPYGVVAGVTLVGMSLIAWLSLAANDQGSAVGPADYAYSAGLLISAYGGVTWSMKAAPTERFRRVAQAVVDVFPLVAVALCVVLLLVTPADGGPDVVKLGTAGVVVLALARQVVLTITERRARAGERAASARLETEIRTRASVLASLARLEAAGTAEETAIRICEGALRLDGIDGAVVRAFRANGEAVVIGAAGAGALPELLGVALPHTSKVELALRPADGPWTETYEPSSDPDLGALYAAGLRVGANSPLQWNDRIIGVITLGSASEASRSVIAERLTTVSEFGVVAGALLGPALEELARLDDLRSTVAATIHDLAFHPVFQPILDLASGATLGYEALTRFDDGKRPDLWFADAVEAGLGVELETACLRAAQREAIALPAGRYLSLNVSPTLANALLPLLAVLEFA